MYMHDLMYLSKDVSHSPSYYRDLLWYSLSAQSCTFNI